MYNIIANLISIALRVFLYKAKCFYKFVDSIQGTFLVKVRTYFIQS